MDRQAGTLVLRRAAFLIEAALIGAVLLISLGMAIWNAGKWLVS